MVYQNLKYALKQKNISIKKYAEFLEINEKTVQNKLNGTTDFTYREFKKTCNFLFPEYNADFLFLFNQSENISIDGRNKK